jgi:DNA mismatch repair ATPase MutS
MKVICEENGELKFTYEFVDGVCDHSYANFTAQKMGIDEGIIRRAEEVCTVLKAGKSLIEVPPSNQEDEKQMTDLALKMETLYDDFANWDMVEDPLGFLEKAKSILSPNDSFSFD